MPFERPTLSDLRGQAQADLAAAVPGTDPLLPVSNLGILADLLAEGFNDLYGYLDWISRQATPFKAADEVFEGWAGLKGVVRKAAVKAVNSGTWVGAPGAVLVAGTQVSWNGQTYTVDADATVGGAGSVTATFTAAIAGAPGTVPAGAAIVLGQAVAGISAAGVASTAVTTGVDLEDFTAYRTRVLATYAAPPQGGAANDYVEWALAVGGVTRAWCVRNGLGAGTVVVYFMMDLAQAANGGFPQGTNGVAAGETRDVAATGDQLTVADAIFPLQPVTALVYAYAPSQNPVAFTISLPGASTVLKQQVSDAIAAVFLAFGAPGGTVNLSDIEAAISATPGTAGFVITAESCPHGTIAPTDGNIASAAGYLPVLGVVTWV